MVTDPQSAYTSPAGKEFTLAAARIAGLTADHTVLDMGCGYGEASALLASTCSCRVTAVDNNPENIKLAQERAAERHCAHLITFETANVLEKDYSAHPFHLVLAEGGLFSFIGRKLALTRAHSWLAVEGFVSFSDLVLLSDKVPDELKTVFEDDLYHYESEHSYRRLLDGAGFSTELICLVPLSGWDNYYAHMARRLEDASGVFADRRVKLAFHKEIDAFYRLEGFRYVGYLFGMGKKIKNS